MKKEKNKELAVRFQDQRGELVTLTGSIVRDYISTDPAVTDKEIFMFLKLAQFMHLNPFLKEIYLVKFKDQPAQFVVSYHTLLMRAEANENYDGMEVKIEGKEPPDLKATAIVYRKDRSHPTVVEVEYSEAVRMIYDKQTHQKRPMGPWATMPKWMLRKTAIARALREAFPGIVGPAAVQIGDSTDPTAEVKPYRKFTDEETEEALVDLYGDKEEIQVRPEPPAPKETEEKTETETHKITKKTSKDTPITPQQKNVILLLGSKLGLDMKKLEQQIQNATYEEGKNMIAFYQAEWRKQKEEFEG